MLKSIATVFALLLATDATAQASAGRYAPVKGSGPQRGVQARRDPAPVARPTTQMTPTPTPVAIKLVPAVVMSDGSILADFGFGLELVRRACAGAVGSLGGRIIGANGQALSQPAPSLQPVPSQQTASQQLLPSASQRQPSRAALGSCFTRDASGRAFVTK